MAIIKLGPENFQNYELVANPTKTFESSSSGVTGSIALFADASTSLKDLDPTFGVSEEGYDDNYIDSVRIDIQTAYADGTYDGYGDAAMQTYLDAVNNHPQGDRQNKRQEVLRFIPGAKPDKNFQSKQVIKKCLFPYYINELESLDWAYTNYNCLNFFTASTVPSESALIYPAGTGSVADQDLNYYAPSSSFTFDFFIKPKLGPLLPSEEYKAGTILHMSSCYAISLVTGSSLGPNGLADKFRILLQLSQSADIRPSLCNIGASEVTHTNGPDQGFLYATTDNSLSKDEWHHITLRWPGTLVNGGSGSIDIDGVKNKEFVITSGTVMQASQSGATTDDPNAVFVGNFYEGTNSGEQAISRFFASTVAANQGLTPFPGSGDADPINITLGHPLRAEVHDIKIYNSYKTDKEVISLGKKGPTSLDPDLLFYVPPFFVQETRPRNILQTPFFDTTGTSEDPFNVALSFGVGGLEINLENFSREFVRGEYPRLHNLTSSIINAQVQEEGLTANDILYATGSSLKRLYTLLPCDNGRFLPGFNLLSTGSDQSSKFVDSFGITRLDLVSLEDMVSTASLPTGLRSLESVPSRTVTIGGTMTLPEGIAADDASVQYGTGSFLFDLQGASPEDPSVAPGSILTILQRTGDPSSNEIVMFDVSNMFYGDRIKRGSLVLEDLNPTGSADAFTLTLRDDKHGRIYRADTPLSGAATWNSVGNIMYDEGLILIKSPHLPFFGKERFKIKFEGERSVYVFEVSIPVNENLHNSSSNPSYRQLRPSDYSNESATDFTYITGIQLHDDNLNIVGRAHLAQPFVKRESDRVVIKLRMDF